MARNHNLFIGVAKHNKRTTPPPSSPRPISGYM